MIVRLAEARDVAQACSVLRTSIQELCSADHQNDPTVLQRWLANKTVENVTAWRLAAGQGLFVADRHGEILGVGLATAVGRVTLNYVSPDARFQGVSSAILKTLEAYLRHQGCITCSLSSTQTAKRFYLKHGYAYAGVEEVWGKLSAQPMIKRLYCAV